MFTTGTQARDTIVDLAEGRKDEDGRIDAALAQLAHRLARDNHARHAVGTFGQRGIDPGQPVAIGRHGTQAVALALEQHAVQVVTHVLAGHGELGGIDQLLQLQLAYVEFEHGFPILDIRVFGRRQGRQVEAGTTGADDQALAFGVEADVRPFRQAAADIQQLAGRHCGAPILAVAAEIDLAYHLHLEICPGQR